ncbi:MAG: SurA N-terminal domain-containing protein [Deltaproteobacteria bacterium]|nr:SurA N-terminal domain-containing protein [Deltaproteobacteria bacterium]
MLPLVASALCLVAEPGWQEIDRAVAEVGDQVITASEVEAEVAVQLVRAGRVELVRSSSITKELRRASLVALVVRSLLLSEARRLKLRPVAESAVDAAVEDLAGRFANQGDFLRFLDRVGLGAPQAADEDSVPAFAPTWSGGGSSALRSVLRAELSAARFVELRVTPAATRDPSKDARAAAKNALRSFVLRLADRTPIRYAGPWSIDLAAALEERQ